MSGYEVGKINFKKAFKKIGKAALVTAVPGAGAAMVLAKKNKKQKKRANVAARLASLSPAARANVQQEFVRRKAEQAEQAQESPAPAVAPVPDDDYQDPPDDYEDDGGDDGDYADDDMEGEIGAAGVFKAFGKGIKGLASVAKAVGPGVASIVPGAGPALAVAMPLVKAAKAGNKGAQAKVKQVAVKAALGDPQAANALEVMKAASAVQNHVAANNAPSPLAGQARQIAQQWLQRKYGL